MATSTVGPPRSGPEPTLYEAVGGEPFFHELVDRFYDHVESDPDLLALYPDQADLSGARERFRLFLCQYWGGPTTYNEQRGHPRLRMRHGPFVIDPAARDRWLAAMRSAMDEMEIAPAVEAAMWEYFTMAAEAMRNSD